MGKQPTRRRGREKEEPMALYSGIDLHSNNMWVAVLDGPSKVVKERRLPNDLGALSSFLEPFRCELAGIVVESTFNWYWLVDGLMSSGYRVHLANTSAIKQYEGKKYADDQHDARWLAEMLALGILPEGYIYPREERPVRDLLRRRAFLVNKRTSMILSMRSTFECCTGIRARPRELDKFTFEELSVLTADEDTAFGMSCLAEPIRVLSEQIRMIEKRVLPKARLRDEFKPLLSVWGIGKIIALTVMYEVGDIRRFNKVGNYASYCRCVKSERRTNQKSKGRGNSKNGNAYLSWAYSEASNYAQQYHEPARKFFERKRSRRNWIVANRALAHKLARASYYVMRDQVEFDPNKMFGR